MLHRDNTPEISLRYSYDELNRLTAVRNNRQNNMRMVEYTYNESGGRETMFYPHNGVATRYEYNDAHLLTSMENRRRETAISSWKNEYYLDGNQASKTDQDGNTTTYLYDSFGQLVEESDPCWQTIRYEYDRFGNRAAMAVSGCEEYEVAYHYHPNNWLLSEERRAKDSIEFFRYQYDGNGNQCYRLWERRNVTNSGNPGKLGFTSENFREAEILLDLREGEPRRIVPIRARTIH